MKNFMQNNKLSDGSEPFAAATGSISKHGIEYVAMEDFRAALIQLLRVVPRARVAGMIRRLNERLQRRDEKVLGVGRVPKERHAPACNLSKAELLRARKILHRYGLPPWHRARFL